LIGAAEPRLKLFAQIFRWLADKIQSPLRGSKQISIATQGRRLALGRSADPAPQLVE
jgi:hypothetical protein